MMPARLLESGEDFQPAIDLSNAASWVRLVEAGSTPGAWAVRLRCTTVEPIQSFAVFKAEGAYDLYVDGDLVCHGSLSEDDPDDAARAMLHLDLAPGRHEIFAYIWDFRPGWPSPGFAFNAGAASNVLATGFSPWESCRLKNVEPLNAPSGRVRVVGEPTGPNGMNRGAEWKLVVAAPEDYPAAHWYAPEDLRALAPSQIVVQSVSPSGSEGVDDFVNVLQSEGVVAVPAGERSTIRLQTPLARLLPRLRASGGEGSQIRIGFSENADSVDVFEPRGFRQDFFSFEPFPGGEASITLEGGERGMALFRLGFLQAVDA